MPTLRRNQVRDGNALFGFFAANDSQLRGYLNALPASERAAMIGTLDGALSAPTAERFTVTLGSLVADYIQAPEGSEEEARLNAVTRMLGLVLKDRYRQDPRELWEFVSEQVAALEDGEDDAEEDVYDRARADLARWVAETGLSDEWTSQAVAAHWAGDVLASRLIAAQSGDALTRELQRIHVMDDIDAARRAVAGLAWCFAFDGSTFARPPARADAWLENVGICLGPVEGIEGDADAVGGRQELLDRYRAAQEGGDAQRFFISLARWVAGHLRIDLEGDMLTTSMVLAATSIELKRELQERS